MTQFHPEQSGELKYPTKDRGMGLVSILHSHEILQYHNHAIGKTTLPVLDIQFKLTETSKSVVQFSVSEWIDQSGRCRS